MALTLPITLGVKALTPDAAFLDQMWWAGIVLFAMLASISLAWPEPTPSAEAEEDAGSPEPGSRADLLPERDLLFDVLSIGAVVATVALVLFFW